MGLRALPYQRYALAFTAGVLTDRYGTRVTSSMLTDAGYVDLGLDLNEDSTTDVAWWIPSGRVTPNASAFYAPSSHIDGSLPDR